MHLLVHSVYCVMMHLCNYNSVGSRAFCYPTICFWIYSVRHVVQFWFSFNILCIFLLFIYFAIDAIRCLWQVASAKPTTKIYWCELYFIFTLNFDMKSINFLKNRFAVSFERQWQSKRRKKIKINGDPIRFYENHHLFSYPSTLYTSH